MTCVDLFGWCIALVIFGGLLIGADLPQEPKRCKAVSKRTSCRRMRRTGSRLARTQWSGSRD